MRALITGVTGQDGSYLAEQLTADGHEVWGLVRGQANPKRGWIQQLVPSLQLLDGDLLDQSSLVDALQAAKPDVVFNLGAVTFVGMSWQQPTLMTEVTGLGVLRLLEAIRQVDPAIRLVQASSSEMFGSAPAPQNELTPFRPRSPYGAAKAFAHHTTVNYRESYGLHASTAIMFNHESPRRGEEFVTRKVSLAVARIAAGQQREPLELGNSTAYRDWGWAPEYVAALPLIAQQETPGDYVLATGEAHSVADLYELAFREVGLSWAGNTRYNPSLLRPADVQHLRGDATRAREMLGWQARVRFAEVVRRLVESDLQALAA
jgi:GDPmannose 4,6-dehydratase